MSQTSSEEIAERIRSERLRRRLLQREVASAAGCTRETIGRLERGVRRPHRVTLEAVGRVLDLELVPTTVLAPADEAASNPTQPVTDEVA